MHAAQLVSMGKFACRHLHEGKAVLWHVPETRESDDFFYFTPTRTGARVQQLTREIAHQIASSPTHVSLSIDQHLEYRRMQLAPDAIASAVQVLQSEEGVYYAFDGAEPFMPIAFRYSKPVLCL